MAETSIDTEPAGHGLTAAAANFRIVFANPGLRNLQLAFLGSVIGDWAYGTAVMV